MRLVDYPPAVEPRFLFTVHHLIGLSITDTGDHTAQVRLTREQFDALRTALESK